MIPKNLTGRVFRQLTVIEPSGKVKGRRTWLCRCICGTETRVPQNALLSGNTGSCGCRKRNANLKHGQMRRGKKNRLFSIWQGMMQRCYLTTCKDYKNYGARGITVDERWQSFENFSADMAPRPSPKHSLERKDNDGPYSKDNCIWATNKEQLRNTRVNRILEFNGERMCVAAWAERMGMVKETLYWRLSEAWSVEEALTTPVRKRKRPVSA